MDLEEKNEQKAAGSATPNLTKTRGYSSRLSLFFEHIHTVNALHMISALSQIMLGLSVVVLSVLGLIRPLWISAIMSMAGSIVTMIGVYFLYNIALRKDARDQLVRDAMHRIMNAQN